MTQSPADENNLIIRLLGAPYPNGRSTWNFAPSEVINIGRSSKNDVHLPEERISRNHATIRHATEGWICNSLGRNGVLYRGEPISELVLTTGTVLEFGNHGPRLHFQCAAAEIPIESKPGGDDEVVDWISGLARGEEGAANNLWTEYFERVVRLAKSRISARQRRISDEEDVAISVFESLCEGMKVGRYPDLKSHDSLWRLLCVMTKRKVNRHVTHERRQKRGGGMVRGESVFVRRGDESGGFGLEQFGGDAANRFSLELADQAEWLFNVLGDDELRRITELKLQGHTNEEIAENLGVHVRTVKRRLSTIRSVLSAAMSDEEE